MCHCFIAYAYVCVACIAEYVMTWPGNKVEVFGTVDQLLVFCLYFNRVVPL